MEKEIKMPKISEDAESGMISEVYIQKGDKLEAEQSIIAVESDKATVDVPVGEGGTVKSVEVSEGDEIHIGDLILLLEVNGDQSKSEEEAEKEDKSAKKSDKDSEEGGEETSESKEKTEAKDKDAAAETDEKEEKTEKDKGSKKSDSDDTDTEIKSEKKQDDEEVSEDESSKGPVSDKDTEEDREQSDAADIPAAPLAKKFARELGIDLNELVDKSDPDQRITREDVFNYARNLLSRKQSESRKLHRQFPEIELPDFSKWGETERKPMSAIRRITTETVSASWHHIPQVTNFDEADVTEMEAYRSAINEKAEHKISMTVMLIKIISKALQAFPKFNASLDIEKQEVIYKRYVNIGFAVDTSRGLLIPVIKNVDEKSLEDIALELKELVDQSNKGKLSKADMSGGNIVLSNLGVLGTTNFVPLIFPPDAAILGVSKAQMKPVWDGSEFVPRTIMPMSLTYDHRLIDGADAARFLRWIGDIFENPYRAILDE